MTIETYWRTLFIDFISYPLMSTQKAKAMRVMLRSRGYVLVGDNLYKHGSAPGVLMKCVPREDSKEIL